MYMGRYAPKEGKNHEKVTFYFAGVLDLTHQHYKINTLRLLPRTCSARAFQQRC